MHGDQVTEGGVVRSCLSVVLLNCAGSAALKRVPLRSETMAHHELYCWGQCFADEALAKLSEADAQVLLLSWLSLDAG